MQITTHADARMNQRGISKKHLGLALEHGECHGDKVILSAKTARERLCEMRYEIKELEAIAKKGGVTIVIGSGHVITTYRANSFSATAAKKVRG